MALRRTPTRPITLALACGLTLSGCATKQRPVGGGLRYDVSRYQTTDDALLGYVEGEAMALGDLDSARALAVGSDDSVWVAGRGEVRGFSADGSAENMFRVEGAPRCLDLDEHDRCYIGFEDHVEVFGNSGERLAAWPGVAGKALLTAIAAGEKEIFVADAGNRVVLRYNRDGEVIGRLGRKDTAHNVPGFAIPSPYFDLSIGSDGMLWVANPGRQRVEAYTFDGRFELSWGKASLEPEGFSGCCNPVHLAAVPGGGFVTSEKGIRRVKLYDATGDFECLVAGPSELGKPDQSVASDDPEADAKGTFDVAVDSTGRVLALDTTKRQVRIFTPKNAGVDESAT